VRFRAAVFAAHGGRCASSRLPEPRLLDAAHIVADRDAAQGQPVVPDGLPLSKLHHAAFDARRIGIDPEFRLHVSDRLLARDDGPMLAVVMDLHGETIHRPPRGRDRPDRDRVAARFELFRAGARGEGGCRGPGRAATARRGGGRAVPPSAATRGSGSGPRGRDAGG
jgi:putative restriction endonuclease